MLCESGLPKDPLAAIDGSPEKSDEKGRRRSLFASLPLNPVEQLKQNAKVLATQNISGKVKVGFFGQVIDFVRDDGPP